MQPKNEYGFVIITADRFKDFEPKLRSDQWWDDGYNKWEPTIQESGFCPSIIYRRKISPGDCFEIVPEGTPQNKEMEYTFDGEYWHKQKGEFNEFIRVATPGDVLAYRIRKQSLPAPVEQSPWRPIGDLTGLPESGNVITGYYCSNSDMDGLSIYPVRYLKANEQPVKHTHWQPIAPVPKPKPMTEEEALYKTLAPWGGNVWSYIKVGWNAHIEFIKKGGGK